MSRKRLAVTGAKVFDGRKMCKDFGVVIEADRIVSVVPVKEIPGNIETAHFEGCTIAPGLIDLQIYGADGYLFSQNLNGTALGKIADSIAATGTTGFVLTLATNSLEVFCEAADVVRRNPHPALLGLHFEGPFIHTAKRGAHLAKYIHSPRKEEVESLLKATGDVLRIVTLAPECCDPEIISMFSNAGVLVSAGHSNATFAEAQTGFRHGIKAVTHLFNAMSPLHHRETGLPGATYLDEKVSASIIADGIHVDFSAVELSKKLLGERLFLITDAVAACTEGPYQHVEQQDRFTLPDGTLSGSKLTLMKAVKNCVEYANIPLQEALPMASSLPARLLGLEERGEIRAGSYADLIVFDDTLNHKASMLRGKFIE